MSLFYVEIYFDEDYMTYQSGERQRKQKGKGTNFWDGIKICVWFGTQT